MGCSGCGSGGAEDRRAFSSADSWYAPPSDLAGFRPLDKERFAPVIADLQWEAQAALADVPAKRVSAEVATRLVGRPAPMGRKALVAALSAVPDSVFFSCSMIE
jgi:hypothetical protein